MPDVVNIHAAKTHFSRLVARAEAGEEVIVARDGRRVARLVPLEAVEPTTSPPPRERHGVAEAVATYGAAAWTPPPSADVLPAIVGRIVRLVDPARIVLFGSRASGQARDDSDYDLLIVVDRADNRRASRIELGRALLDVPAALDLVVVPAAEVEPGWRGPRGVAQWAAEGGRVIYERA